MIENIDKHIGDRLKNRRIERGWTQEKLGEATGVSFQQIQKYEKGKNGINCHRLYDLARILETSISYFFPDLQQDEQTSPHFHEEHNDFEHFPIEPYSNEHTFLLRYFNNINDPKLRKQLISLMRSMAEYTANSLQTGNDSI